MGTAVQAALLFPVFLGFAGLAIDTGWAYGARTHLQDVADVAALAGVPETGNVQNVRAAVRSIAAANAVAGSSVTIADADIEVGSWDGSTFTPNNAGTYIRVTARRPGHALFLAGMFGMPTVDLTAVAIAGRDMRVVSSWPCIMFADASIEFNGSAIVTGYDSTTGAVTQPGVCGNVANVRLQGNYELYGDIHTLPNGTVSVGNSAVFVGEAIPMPNRFNLPRVAFPAAPGTRPFPAPLRVGNHNVITLTGGLPYRLPDGFEQQAQDEIVINNGPIEIFSRGTFSLNGGGIVNTGQDPHDLTVHHVGAGSVHINGGSSFYGTIDAPDSEVELNGNANFYGSLTGRVIHHNGNQDVFLDTSLGEANDLLVPAPSRRTRLVW